MELLNSQVSLRKHITRKWKESGFRPLLCTYRLNWARKMIEMTLSSRNRTRNSSPGVLRPSTLPLGHGGSPQNFHTWMWKKHFCFFQTTETGNRTPNSGVEGSGANHYPRAPAHTSQDILSNTRILGLAVIPSVPTFCVCNHDGCWCNYTVPTY